jgi:hypothetical protein
VTGPTSQFIRETYRQPYRSAPLGEKIGPDGTVPEAYNAFIWELAKRFTNSGEEAEAAVREMLIDIHRCAESASAEVPIEKRLTARIAFRRLLKLLQ